MDAVKSFEVAHRLDPSLPAMERIQSIIRWVTRVQDLIQRKARIEFIRINYVDTSSKNRLTSVT